MTLFEILAALADLLKLKNFVWAPSNSHRRAEIILTGQGPRGLIDQPFDIGDKILGLDAVDGVPLSKSQTEAVAAFRHLPARRRALRYYDNDRQDSEVLVVLLHGLGLDQDDFRSFLLETELHCLAPTLYGFHLWDEDPLPLPLSLHCRLMADFIEYNAARNSKKHLVLGGFSTGADLLLEVVPLLGRDTIESIRGVLLLDPNVNQSTCFISGELKAAKEDRLSALALAQKLGEKAADIDGWLDKHRYLVRVLGKFNRNLEILFQFADEIFLMNDESGVSRFSARIAETLSAIANAHLVFSGSDLHRQLLPQIEGALSDRHGERTLQRLTWAQGTNHFGLLDADFLREAIEDVSATA